MASALRRGALSVAAILLLGLAAVGLVEAGVAIGSARAGTTPISQAATTSTTSDAGLAADVDLLLATDQTVSADPTSVGRVELAAAGLRRLAAARHLVHGTVVVDLPKHGGLTTVQLDHGTVSAVTATSLTIAETGGTSATVALGDETHVRKHAARAAIADLTVGDEVFVLSKVESDGTVAYLVIVPAI